MSELDRIKSEMAALYHHEHNGVITEPPETTDHGCTLCQRYFELEDRLRKLLEQRKRKVSHE